MDKYAHGMSQLTPRAFLALGVPNPGAEEIWKSEGGFDSYISYRRARPSGRRLGKLALGLGIDCLVLVVSTLVRFPRRTTFLCASPWIAVALRLFGVKHFEVTGIYATSGSRSWRVLRSAIGSNPVVTMLDVEAEEWNACGGRAMSVAYGNTFGYPTKVGTGAKRVRIFVGGTSDRDPAVLSRLIEEVTRSKDPVELIIADGTGPETWVGGHCRIERLAVIPYTEFGEELAKSDVAFLPLLNKERSAGHMVTVGALESGLQVMTTDVTGMQGYIDGEFVVPLVVGDSILSQLIDLASGVGSRSPEAVRAHWNENFSLRAYARRVSAALKVLRAM